MADLLPPSDRTYLVSKGFTFEILPDGGSELLLVIRGIKLLPEKFDQLIADVLLKLPPGYPIAQLDMFWVSPALHYASGAPPPSADQYEQHEGRTWQRFSRHLPGGAWRPGVDCLRTYLPLILAELTEA